MKLHTLARALLGASLVFTVACGEDTPKRSNGSYFPIPSPSTGVDAGGDGDGEDAGVTPIPSPNPNPFPGDGDGDGDAGLNPGDGDGDAGLNSGDGDGDAGPNPGDGDGDAGLNPGDGDAGLNPGDGDGDAGLNPGDGDGLIRGPAPTVESASKNGPYTVKSYTNGFRDGPKYASATVWYPSDAEPPFAITAIVPGWVSSEGDITDWGPFLASHGIVNITIGTNSPLTDLPPARKEALLDALITLKEENTRLGSPLNGKLDLTRQAAAGWSMGGGGALLAGTENPWLKAVISMCGWGGYDYSKNTVPSLLFASVLDPLAGGQTQGFYAGNPNSIPDTTPKLIYEVATGDHWTANNPAHENGRIGLYGLSWLKVFLEGDERYRPFLKQKPANSSDYRTNL